MASTIRSIVYTAASRSVPNPYESSSLLWNAVSVAHTVHRSYHFLARIDRYTTPENAPSLLMGVVLEMAVGDKKIVNFVAKTLEASLHTLKGINAYIRLARSIDKFQKLIRFQEGNLKKMDLMKELDHPYVSSSILLEWAELRNRFRYTFFHLIDTIVEISANFFLLASHMVAACEAMQGHELQVIEGPMNIRDIFKEAYKLNQEDFVSISDRILKGLGAKFDTRSLYAHYEKNEEGKVELKLEWPAPAVESAMESVKKIGQHFLSRLVKHAFVRSALPPSLVVLSPYPEERAAANFRTVIIRKKLK